MYSCGGREMVSTLFYTTPLLLYKGRWNYFPVIPLQKQTWSLKVISFVYFWETLVLTPKGKGRCFDNDLKFSSESFYSITWGSRAALLFTDIFHLFVLILKNLQKQIVVFSHHLHLEPCCGWAQLRAQFDKHLCWVKFVQSIPHSFIPAFMGLYFS